MREDRETAYDKAETDYETEQELRQATISTWCMILFFVLTDLWLLSVAIMAVKEAIGDPFISPVGWAISLTIVNGVIGLVWCVIYLRGFLSVALRKKDISSMSIADYYAWTLTGLKALLLYFVIVCVSVISFVVRYPDPDLFSKSRSDFESSEEARLWIFLCLTVVAITSFFAVFFHSISTWKYWSLVWSCGNQSIFKNPFYPQKTIVFSARKQK